MTKKREGCVFCKIVNKEIPVNIIDEGDDYIAFNDLCPIAPVHVLVIPKKHIPSVADMDKKDAAILGNMIYAAKKIAEKLKISKGGYKLLFRVRNHGAQEIMHIHLHLIGGARLREDIGSIK